MARLTLPDDAAMTAEQRAVCDEAVAGRRGKVPAPMIAWVRNPELARHAQRLGEALRFGTVLDRRRVELAILVCARHWTAHQVWTSHVGYARQAGLEEAAIAAIAARTAPAFASGREAIVFEVCSSLLERRRLAPALYGRAVADLGERGLVELVAIVGYYGLVCLTADAFELGLPGNAAAELGDPDVAGPG